MKWNFYFMFDPISRHISKNPHEEKSISFQKTGITFQKTAITIEKTGITIQNDRRRT